MRLWRTKTTSIATIFSKHTGTSAAFCLLIPAFAGQASTKSFLLEANTPSSSLGELKQLDLSDPFDLRVRQEVDHLDASYAFVKLGSQKTNVVWGTTAPTQAHLTQGLVLNREQLLKSVNGLKSKFDGPLAESIIYIAALSHERAHLGQVHYYGEATLNARPPKVVETQADIIAGTWVGGKIFNPGTLMSVPPDQNAEFLRYVEQFMRCANQAMQDFGKARSLIHGNSFQRSEATALGALLSMDIFFTSQGVDKMILDAKAKEYVEGVKPRIGLRPNERMMEWSLRKSYQMCGMPFPKNEPSKMSPLVAALSSLIAATPAFGDARGDEGRKTERRATYKALIQIPDAGETTISINLQNVGRSYAIAYLYEGTDLETAKKVMAAWKTKIIEALPEGYKGHEDNDPGEEFEVFRSLTLHSDFHRDVVLSLTKSKDSNEITVDITIEES